MVATHYIPTGLQGVRSKDSLQQGEKGNIILVPHLCPLCACAVWMSTVRSPWAPATLLTYKFHFIPRPPLPVYPWVI